MKYQQVPLTRLSSAGTRLEQDGQWHAFGAVAGVWYRVHGRVVQRVTLEAGEDSALLRLFDGCGPLPSKALKEGFREELCFRISDDRYTLAGMLLRFFVGWDVLALAGRDFGVATRFYGGNSLEYSVFIEEWTSAAMTRAVVTAKAFAMVGSSLALDAKQGIPHTEAEIKGLLRTARELLAEEAGVHDEPKPARLATQQQQSLFPD
jgi:hypothetical protein